MKKLLILILLIFSFISISNAAEVEQFVKGNFGYSRNKIENIKKQNYFYNFGFSYGIILNKNYEVSSNFQYNKFAINVAYEDVYSYSFKLKNFLVGGNFNYLFTNETKFTPYVGTGLYFNKTNETDLSNSYFYALRGGLKYEITKSVFADINAQFLKTFKKLEFNTEFYEGVDKFKLGSKILSINLGIGYKF